jgi:hypothetical protein
MLPSILVYDFGNLKGGFQKLQNSQERYYSFLKHAEAFVSSQGVGCGGVG